MVVAAQGVVETVGVGGGKTGARSRQGSRPLAGFEPSARGVGVIRTGAVGVTFVGQPAAGGVVSPGGDRGASARGEIPPGGDSLASTGPCSDERGSDPRS
jgi:hypothetical protein